MRWESYTKKFGQESDVVIVVEGSDRDRILDAIDTLGENLQSETELFDRVLFRVESDNIRPKALQFLTPKELETIESSLESQTSLLEGDWDQASVQSHSVRLARGLQASTMSPGFDAAPILLQAEKFVSSLNRFLKDSEDFENPWPTLVNRSESPEAAFEPKYQLTPDGRMGFVIVRPKSTSSDFSGGSKALSRMREICSQVDADFPEVSIGLTGIPVLEADEMERSQKDMMNASAISFIGVGLILLVGFRGLRHPFLALLMLAVALIWSLGYTTLAIGHLNILSVSFAAILIGLGIDFAIHYLARYLELRHHNEEFHRSLALTSASVGTGIVTAAVTTSLAFLCATFTDFLGVAELGIIAGGGILLCAIATFTVLPPLITLADRKLEPQSLPTPFQGNLLRSINRRYPWGVTLITLAAIFAIGSQGFTWKDGQLQSRVEYDSNLMNLQAEGVASVELQQRLFDEADGSLLYAVSIADSIEEVRIRRDEFLALPTVSRVEEMASYLPRFPASETNLLVQAIHARLSRLSELPRAFPEVNPLNVGQSLEQLLEALQNVSDPIAQQAANEIDESLDLLAEMQLPQQVELLTVYQAGMLKSLHKQFAELKATSNPQPIVPEDYNAGVHERFLSKSGDWLIRVFPTEEIWEEEPLKAFVNDVRSVDPEATGTPLQNFEAARQIRESYFDAAIYALIVVTLILLVDALSTTAILVTFIAPLVVAGFAFLVSQRIGEPASSIYLLAMYTVVAILVAFVFDFESTRNVILTMLPPIAGGILMFGIFGILHVDLNPANLIVLPLILGIGVDDGVHVTHDFRHSRKPYETSPSTINAVTLTSLTSMVGFGSMMVAAHQGLVSLGIVLVVGVGSCLFVSLVTLPAILTLVDRGRRDQTESIDSNERADESEDELVSIQIRQRENGVA